jgi:hypothetical protein
MSKLNRVNGSIEKIRVISEEMVTISEAYFQMTIVDDGYVQECKYVQANPARVPIRSEETRYIAE